MVTGEITPDTDIGCFWSSTTGSPHHDQVNEAHGSPNTATYIGATESGGDDNAYETLGFTTLDDIQDNSITQIKVYVYGFYLGGQPEIAVSWNNGASFSALVNMTMATDYSWTSYTYAGLSYSKADLDQFQVRFRADCPDKFDANNLTCIYAVVTYTEAATGWAHKFTGVEGASIGKVSGVAIGSIGKIKGVE